MGRASCAKPCAGAGAGQSAIRPGSCPQQRRSSPIQARQSTHPWAWASASASVARGWAEAERAAGGWAEAGRMGGGWGGAGWAGGGWGAAGWVGGQAAAMPPKQQVAHLREARPWAGCRNRC